MSTGSLTIAALTGSATQPDARAIASATLLVFPVIDWYTTLVRMIPPLTVFTSGATGVPEYYQVPSSPIPGSLGLSVSNARVGEWMSCVQSRFAPPRTVSG